MLVESARDAVKPGGRANKNYHGGLAGTSGNSPFLKSTTISASFIIINSYYFPKKWYFPVRW
jgi:hypothetical protein